VKPPNCSSDRPIRPRFRWRSCETTNSHWICRWWVWAARYAATCWSREGGQPSRRSPSPIRRGTSSTAAPSSMGEASAAGTRGEYLRNLQKNTASRCKWRVVRSRSIRTTRASCVRRIGNSKTRCFPSSAHVGPTPLPLECVGPTTLSFPFYLPFFLSSFLFPSLPPFPTAPALLAGTIETNNGTRQKVNIKRRPAAALQVRVFAMRSDERRRIELIERYAAYVN